MIRGDVEVIGHRPPVPRIETSPVWPVETQDWQQWGRDEMWREQRQAEGDRIWKLLQEAAQ